MAIHKVFKSMIPSMNYVCKDGFTCVFLGGKYIADNEQYVSELIDVIGKTKEGEPNVGINKSKHPFIYIDEVEQEVDTEVLSPLEQIKKDAYEAARADILRSMSMDAGTSKQGDFSASVATSATMAAASASDSNAPANLNAAQLISAAKAGTAKLTAAPIAPAAMPGTST